MALFALMVILLLCCCVAGFMFPKITHTHTHNRERGGREREDSAFEASAYVLFGSRRLFLRGLLQPAPISAQPNCPRGADVVAVSPVIPFSAEDFYALSLFCLFFCRFGGIIENRSFIKQTYVWSLGATIFT